MIYQGECQTGRCCEKDRVAAVCQAFSGSIELQQRNTSHSNGPCSPVKTCMKIYSLLDMRCELFDRLQYCSLVLGNFSLNDQCRSLN